MSEETNPPQGIEKIDPAKRRTLSRMLTGSAVVAPVVASFAMNGLAVTQAWAFSNASLTPK